MVTAIRELIRLEPVRVRTVLGALFSLLLALGIDVPEDTRGTIIDLLLNIVAPMLPIVMGALSARKAVVPLARIQADPISTRRLGL